MIMAVFVFLLLLLLSLLWVLSFLLLLLLLSLRLLLFLLLGLLLSINISIVIVILIIAAAAAYCLLPAACGLQPAGSKHTLCCSMPHLSVQPPTQDLTHVPPLIHDAHLPCNNLKTSHHRCLALSLPPVGRRLPPHGVPQAIGVIAFLTSTSSALTAEPHHSHHALHTLYALGS